MIGFGQILEIAKLLGQLVNMIFQHSNSPQMVQRKIDQMHQDVTDKVNGLQAILQDPTKSKADKDAAIEQLRIFDS